MLGGEDIYQILIDYIADNFKKSTGIDLTTDQTAIQRLKDNKIMTNEPLAKLFTKIVHYNISNNKSILLE